MFEWFADLSPAGGLVPFRHNGESDWPDARFRGFESRLRYLPVALSELYIMGQSLPLSAVQTREGPLLVAELHAGGMSATPFDKDGRWRLPYRPIALRLLPFVGLADGTFGRIVSHPVVGSNVEHRDYSQLESFLTDFARSVAAASNLIREALAQGLAQFAAQTAPADIPELLTITTSPDHVSLSLANVYRLISVLQFSQAAKGVASTTKRTGAVFFPGTRNQLRPEQILSFDEQIRFYPDSNSDV